MLYKTAKILGLIQLGLVFLMVLPFILRRVKKKFFKNSQILIKILKVTGKAHPYIGYALIILMLIHGYIMTGGVLVFNSGHILLILVILMMAISIIGRRLKIKNWIIFHRLIDIGVMLTLIYHIFKL